MPQTITPMTPQNGGNTAQSEPQYKYEYNGKLYDTEDAARGEQTRQALSIYADAASVGYDEQKFNMLLESGGGLSQMSDSEMSYIKSRYTPSYDTTYKNNAVDQYLYSVGLPPSADLSKYRTSYTKYAEGGGIADNYGNLSDAQWKKINELWQKDWEYGLTDTDYARKAAGLAPSAYDDMYEDTLLDQELKANGLPPSKLLNGKLGETYNAWVKDDEKYNEVMSEFVRNVLKNKPDDARVLKGDGAFANVMNGVYENIHEKQMSDIYDSAYAELLQNPGYEEYLSSHGYSREPLPSETDEKYQLKDQYGNVIDGEYDYQKWNEDYQKAIIKNAKIDEDEFAITREAAEAYYDKHAQDILIEDAAREYLTTNNIDIKKITDEQANSALSYAIGQALNPMTFTDLFGQTDLTDDDRVIYQPVIDEYNRLMKSEGIDAANTYLGSKQYQNDLNASIRQNIIDTYRASFTPGSPNASKTDDEIYGMYVDDVAHEYAITDSDVIAKMKSGDMSLYDYLSQTCASEKGAIDLASRQFEQYCADNHIPMKDGEVDWETLRVNRQKREDAYNYLTTQRDVVEPTYVNYLYDRDVSLLMQTRDAYQEIVDNHKPGEGNSEEYLYAKEQIAQIDSVLRIRSEAEAIDPNYYQYRSDIFGSSELSMYDRLRNTRVGFQYDALAYTDAYKSWVENTGNEYVNQRFDEIVYKHADSLTHGQDEKIASYATDEEKYKTVYIFDKMGYELSDGSKISSTFAEAYLNETLMRKWDASRRDDQKSSTGLYGGQYWGSESESGFVRWAGATGTTLAHIFLGIGEGVVNLAADTATIASGHTIYSSNRANSSSDRMESLSKHLNDIDGNGVGAFFVQLIPSMAQSGASAISAWATGGASEWLTLALMSTQSYSEGVDTALSRGASTGEAYAFGLAQGFAEMYFEKVSLDSMLKNMDNATFVAIASAQAGATRKETIKQVTSAIIKSALAQGFVAEGTEELFTEIAGWVNEAVFLGYNNTSFAEAVNAYVKSGYTQDQAEAMAGKELWKEAIVAYIGGAVSGLLMAGPSSVLSIQSSANYALARLESDAKNLSAISYDRALELAKEVAIKDANGNVTKEGAQAIVEALRAKGADSAALSYVMNSIETTEDVRGVFDSAILEMRRSESARLAKAATDVVARSQGLSKLETQSKLNYMNTAATNYLNALTETLQTADKASLAKAVDAQRNGFLDVVKRESGISFGDGMRIVTDYMRTIDEDELNQGAIPYMSAMKLAALKSNTKVNRNAAAYYGTYAYALTRMASDANFLSAFTGLFGGTTSDVSTNVRDACLNSARGDKIGFVNSALEAIGMFDSMGSGSMSKVLSRGMDGAAYVTSVLAASEASMPNSDSRMLYNYISRNGVTGAVLDALSVAKYYENMPADSRTRADKYARTGTDAFMTSEETAAESDAVESAEKNAQAKAKSVQAQKAHNDQTLAVSQNIVERHKASYDAVTASETVVIEGQVLQTTSANLADVAASYAAALSDAINARDNLAKANEDRLQGAQNDFDLAQKSLREARRKFKAKMNRHAAAYMNMIGSQLETMRSGNLVSNAEFDRITALANYGTREDLNDAVQRIIQTEKRQATAFANEIGAQMEIVKFTKEFMEAHGATYDPNKVEAGFEQNGRVYLNETAFGTNKGAHVGYGVNEVILHEISHVAEKAANNWTAYSKFAVEYMIRQYGDRAVRFVEALGQKGVSELTAEFTRLELLQNQNLIVDLCKNAPTFSIRMHQWLKSITGAMTGSLTNMSTYNRAERLFARALGEATTKVRSETNNEVKTATEKAVSSNNEMVEANTDAVSNDDSFMPEPPPADTSIAYGEELDTLAKAIDNPKAFMDFNAADYDNEYMMLAQKYINGTATEEDVARLRELVDNAAKAAGVIMTSRYNLFRKDPLKLYHGTKPKGGRTGFGFTSFEKPYDAKAYSENLTFAAPTPEVSFSYTGNTLAEPHAREIRTAGNLTIDELVRRAAARNGEGVGTVNQETGQIYDEASATNYEGDIRWNDYVEYANEIGKDPYELLAEDIKQVFGDVDVKFEKTSVEQKAPDDSAISSLARLVDPSTESGDYFDYVPDELYYMEQNAAKVAKKIGVKESELFKYTEVLDEYIEMLKNIATENRDDAVKRLERFVFDSTDNGFGVFDPDTGELNTADTLDEIVAYLFNFIDSPYVDAMQNSNQFSALGSLLNSDYLVQSLRFLHQLYSGNTVVRPSATIQYAEHAPRKLPLDNIVSDVATNRNRGMYELYGKQGSNPYEFNINYGSWSDVRNAKNRSEVGIYGEALGMNREGMAKRLRGEIDYSLLEGLGDRNTTDTNAEYARRLGYDMAIFKNVFDSESLTKNAMQPTDDYIFYNQRGLKSADLVTVDKDGIVPLSRRFNWEDPDLRHYTELQDSINDMPQSVRERCGNPRLMQGAQGMLAIRNVSLDGFLSRNQQGSGARNIAVLERADLYANGQASLFLSPIDLENAVAVVSPSGKEFGDVRNAAWENNATVVTYDLNDPSTFENAIRSAAQADGSLNPFQDFNAFIEQYGAYNEEETRRTGGRLVPQRTSPTNRVHKTLNTIANSQYTSDAQYENGIKSFIENGQGSYEPVSNNRTLNKAKSDIARLGGVRQALTHLNDNVATNTGKNTELLAMAETILMDADAMQSLGQTEYEQLLTDISLVAEDSGRSLQLLRELASLSPQGRMNHIEQTGKRMAAKYEQKTKKPVDLSLTAEEKKAYGEAKTQDEFDAIDEAVTKRWGEQTKDLPLLDRIRNWRYFSMLGNLRTHFRNIVGNLMMHDVARVKDSIKSLYELGIDKQDRTATFITKPMDDATKAFVERETQIAIPLMQNASMKYYQAAKKFGNADSKMTWSKFWDEVFKDVPSAHISNSDKWFGRTLNKASSANSNLLELEDALALGNRFRSVLAQQIQAKELDVNKIPDWQKKRMIQYAMEESLRATFRDASPLADALNQFEKTNAFTKFVMGAIVPFKKTPINIVKRGIEYSPIGFMHGLYKTISNKVSYEQQLKNIDNSNLKDAAKEFRKNEALTKFKNERISAINRLAEGTTGTLLAAIGLLAAKFGWISIGRKDDDQAAFETSLGKNSYSLNIGDMSIDLSAFSPAAIPLLMGAALEGAIKAARDGDESFVPGLVTALTETLDPITEMTMLSGIADAVSGLSYSNNDDAKNTQWAGTLARNTAASFIGQFIPTLVGQAARIADPYARSYSAGKEYWASKYIGAESGSKVKSLQNKIPFAAWLSEPKVDVHGNPVGNYTNWGAGLLHILNNTILPATIKMDQKTDIDEELVRLYGVVDSSDIFPTKPSRSIGSYKDKNGDTVNIKLDNDAEYTEYQMEVGQVTYDALNDLMRSSAYARMDDTQKANAVETTIKNARNSVKKLWKAKKQAGK